MARGALRREAGYTLRYGLVGLAALSLHGVSAFLLQAAGLSALMANLVGFSVGFMVSAIGHALWTFRLTEGRGQAIGRFLIATLVAIAGSSLVLSVIERAAPDSRLSLGAAVITVPVFTYLMARLWAFRDRNKV